MAAQPAEVVVDVLAGSIEPLVGGLLRRDRHCLLDPFQITDQLGGTIQQGLQLREPRRLADGHDLALLRLELQVLTDDTHPIQLRGHGV
jgi:hypothetical protein